MAKLSTDQFAASIKAKYPQYASVDNATLAQKMVAKYPTYADKVETAPAAPAVPAAPDNRDLLQKASDFITKNNLPGAQLGTALGNSLYGLGSAAGKLFKGDVKGAGAAIADAGDANNKLFPKVVGDTVRSAVLPASMAVGGGGVLRTAAQFAGTGAAASAGEALAQGKGIKDTAIDAAKGGAIAGALGAGAGLLPKVLKGAGTLASQALGATTGAGASSIKAAAEGSPAFVAAMRGKINPDEVVQTAQDALDTIKNNRRTGYLADLAKVGENKTSIDISPLHSELQTQLKNFGVAVGKDGLDFSRSSIANNGSARADIQGVYDTLQHWGTKEGDRTPVGLDTLKKQLGDFYSQSGSARSFVQAINSKLGGILKDQVPGYGDMTKGYQKASALIDDIKSATGLGGKAKVDTVFSKLTTAMKGDKELRLEILNTMSNLGEQPDLLDKIAGVNMSPLVPRGLVGKGIDVGTAWAVLQGAFSAKFLPMLLATSPRVVGEFVNGLGIAARKTQVIQDALRAVHASRLLPLVPAATAQLSQSQEQTQ